VPVLYGKCDVPEESAVNVLMSTLWSAQKVESQDDKKQRIKVDDYALRFPTNTSDVARICRDIATYYLDPKHADRELPGILHFSAEEQMTKWQIVQVFAEIMGLATEGMEPFKPEEEEVEKGVGGVKRPYDCHLDTGVLRELGIDVGTVDFRTWW
jgi:S-adenosylmethionine synthetase